MQRQSFKGVLGLTKRDGLSHQMVDLRICDRTESELTRELLSEILSHREAREEREGKRQVR
jgi:hypothetical protein